MISVLILGHRGMLGRSVTAFLRSQIDIEVLTIESRWGSTEFSTEIASIAPTYIINCIGKIPQKNPVEDDYTFINIELPRFLEKTGCKIIHPSTDCEFKGTLPENEFYTKQSVRDADDVYGKSKAVISAEIEEHYHKTKIIRTSIIGHEEKTHVSLLDWFLSQVGPINGYTNHYWNGITTLEWAKQSYNLIKNWEEYPTLNQIGCTKQYSKFDILSLANEVYGKGLTITPIQTPLTVNKCLETDISVPELADQMVELRNFFKK
jgi:dTDP-4-dehydrorhamnose reductase